jgi:hypothetical protein
MVEAHVVLIVAALILVIVWVVPLVATVVAKRTGQPEAEAAIHSALQGPAERALSAVSRRDRWLVSFGPVVLMMSYLMGEVTALHQSVFTILADGEGFVVLRTYGDTMVVAPFNREAKTVSTRVRVISKSELHSKTLVDEGVGPLKSEGPSATEIERERKAGQLTL